MPLKVEKCVFPNPDGPVGYLTFRVTADDLDREVGDQELLDFLGAVQDPATDLVKTNYKDFFRKN